MRGRSYLPIPSCTPYFAAQSAIAKRDQFRPDDRHWPTTRIETRDGVTSIQLRPLNLGASLPAAEQEALIDQMWVLRDQLSPLDADVLDGLFGVWINSAKTPADDVLLYIDDLLGLRGLQKKLSKTGRRGGYREEQRTEIIEAIGRVESVWIEFQAADTPHNRKRKISIIESRAITVSDRCGQRRLDGGLDVRAVLFRPGRVFGAYLFGRGRQVALLATRALRFDPYRQRPEKDLTRYLARQWRVRARAGNYYQPFKIESLLNESSISLSKNDPRRAKHRLETALDTLETEGIISEWHYSGGGWGDDSFTERRGWLGEWLQATVEIETPDAIRDHYAGIEVEREYPQPTQPKPADIGTQLAHERHRLQISQTYTAERLGITPSALSRIEKGKRTPGKTLLTKIGNLLNEWAQIEGGIERL
jgi:DNA-binding XRE family transcriptional regulator